MGQIPCSTERSSSFIRNLFSLLSTTTYYVSSQTQNSTQLTHVAKVSGKYEETAIEQIVQLCGKLQSEKPLLKTVILSAGFSHHFHLLVASQQHYKSTWFRCILPATTQPSIPPGSVNEYQLRLGRQRQVWFIALADERGVCR